jgi:hypothetical protein
MELGQLERMFKDQNNRCYICESDGVLYVDHDHMTKRVRKLLCPRYNQVVGAIEDKRFEKALSYVHEHLNSLKEQSE